MASGGNQGGIFGTGRTGLWRGSATVRALVAALTVGALTTGTAQAAPVSYPQPRTPAAAPRTASIPVTAVVSHYQKPRTLPNTRAQAPVWPTGTATATLPAGSTTPRANLATTQQHGAAVDPSSVRAGSLPVWIGLPASTATGHAAPAATASGSAAVPSKVSVRVLPHSAAEAAGVNGLLLTLARTDGSTTAGHVDIALDYKSFATAFGGDWASRLRLTTLPACVLTTPQVPACRVETPLASENSAAASEVSADVTLQGTASSAGTHVARTAAASRSAAALPLVIAASSAAGGGGGDFSQTSLKASSSWQAGGSTDAFTWSYPIQEPTVPGGLAPQLSLGYDSQDLDGLTSSTNTQASDEGDGFSLPQDYIERSYSSCHQNPTGATQTDDNCWSANNQLTISLNGQTSTLIPDNTKAGYYHPLDDANERVQYETGASNGAQNGEYWVVTTPDGTQYTYGLNHLAGWATGDTATNSVLTEPVYATASGQPCYNATFANSYCSQAYRWMLDSVQDARGDVMSYFYTTDTGYYAQDLGTTAAATSAYTRDARLWKIQYGQRAGAVYTTSPAAQVVFSYNGRCDTASTGCATSQLATSASSFPDVPYDQNCASGAACSVNSPTFWSENELTSIQTQALVGTTETNVDSWAFTYSFPATGDATTPSLWLNSIVRTGQDTSGGGSSAGIPMPAVTFAGTPLSNRVNLSDGYPPITRYRLNTITTEADEVISVDYSSAACAGSTPSDPSQNTSLCYPDYWTPSTDTGAPIEDWFNKYVVTAVTQDDKTGGNVSDDITTTYTPVGSPAWHYNDNPLTPSNQRTWDDWRGYQGMYVSTGTAPDPVTLTEATFFRGMNGDTLPGSGTRSATITDSRGDPAVTDAQQYEGQTYESIVYNGGTPTAPGPVVSDTVADPWSSAATATNTLSGGLPSQQSFMTGTADNRVYTPLASGGTRETETENTYDSYGRVVQVNDLGDVSLNDAQCTTTTYADNTTAWILDAPDESVVVSVPCTTTAVLPADAISDTRTFYDGSTTFGAAPTVGQPTTTEKATSYTGSSPNFSVTQAQTVDEYGRVLTSTDADGRKTTTAYTPATGAEPTSIAVTDPMGQVTTTTYDALRELPLSVTSAAGYVTSAQYDALGRTIAEFKPGITAAAVKYSYTVSDTAPSTATTQTLNNDGSTYRTSELIYDSMFRPRETQTSTEDGGRDVTDTVYNTDGWKASVTAPYYNSGAPSGTLVQQSAGKVPSETGYSYDGAGRQTMATAYALGTATWDTQTLYEGGNITTTIPPAGGTAQSVVVNGLGQTTDLYQYKAGVTPDPVNDPASDYTDTKYTYNPAGEMATEADAAGNTWTWTYNLLGQKTSTTDPDSGAGSSTYDNAGQLLSSTDARGDQTSYTYDLDGRKTAAYDTTGGAAESSSDQIGSWSYDTIKKGLPTASTSYQMGTASPSETSTVLAYNSFGDAAATKTTLANLPADEAALAPSNGYIESFAYNTAGNLLDQQDPASGGLPAETVDYGYDTYGQPTTVGSSLGTYVYATGYDEYGKPLLYTMGTTSTWAQLALTYDPQTNAVTNAETTDSTSSGVVDNTSYTWSNGQVSDGAGLLVSTTDAQNGGAATDTQCFQYNAEQQLSQAWTATDNCAATPVAGSSSTVGGPSPYWQSWTYTADGDRSTETDYDTTGNTANDTTTNYNYPAAGSSTDQPHTLTSTTATGPAATANTANYTYDADGNTRTISGGAAGEQSLTWNDQDKLASDTTAAGTSTYLYDTSGNLILRTDPGTATLFIGDEQIVENTTSLSLTATRYYTIRGTTIAERSNTGDVQYLIPNRQGTDTLAIDAAATQTVTRRQYTPFGQVRGTAPTTWPGDNGYIGGTIDSTTTLENLGAREYDPANGRFVSIDPILETSDPTQLAGYDYSANDPVTGSDPTGNMYDGSTDSGGGTGDAGHFDREDRYLPGAGTYHTQPEGSWLDNAAGVAQGLLAKAMSFASMGNPVGLLENQYVYNPAINYVDSTLNIDTTSSQYQNGQFEADLAMLGAPELEEADLDGLLDGGPCSFAPSTPVLLADGKTEPIGKLKVGDKVESADPTTGKEEGGRSVQHVWINHDTDLLDLTVSTGPGHTAVIHTTANHPFWDNTTHTWVPAGSLKPGHELASTGNHHPRVVSVKVTPGAANRWNLTVQQLHTYYVLAGSTPILVHNSDGCPTVSIYKAPGTGMTDTLLKDGFKESDFPGSGNGYPDGRAYFGLADDGKTIALDYASRGGYDGGVIEIRIPKADFDQHFSQYVGSHNGVPGTEVAIPNTAFDTLNQYPRSLVGQ